MNALKSVFKFLGRFLTSTRIVVTNLITFIFLALVFIGLISVFIPNDRSIDKEGKVVILNPEGVLVDQEVQYSDFQFSFGQVEQIQTRDLIKLIKSNVKLKKVSSDFFSDQYFAPRPKSEKLINKRLNDLRINYMRDWKVCLEEYASNIINEKELY